MAKASSFNPARPSYDTIADHHNNVVASLKAYFSETNPDFTGQSLIEIIRARDIEIRLQELQDVLSLTAFLEALFRVDYISRKQQKLKDSLSRTLIKLFDRKLKKASLEEDIVKSWLRSGAITHEQYTYIKESFKYRHWLAHGQYWVPPPGRDFYDLAAFVEGLINSNKFKV